MVSDVTSIQPVTVRHGAGSYPVYVQAGILSQLPGLVSEAMPGRRVAMIADAVVYQLYRDGRLGAPPWLVETLTFEPGERSKTRESWSRLTDGLIQRRFGRDTGIVALGGGVTGDLAGFVAATYLRGVPYVQVPTTTLAMLDASVGGKTGVDTPQGKNLVGAFHAPAAVIADPETLATLPDREYRSGLAEAVKHALIADEKYFTWMEANAAELGARNPAILAQLIRRSVEIKAEVVAEDERESGRRAILNAGHTVAHALEQASGYELRHGEAVGLGLLVECHLAQEMGIAAAGLRTRLAALLGQLGLPVRLPAPLPPAALLEGMALVKKNREGQINFALTVKPGTMHRRDGWTTSIQNEHIQKGLATIY